MMEVTVEIRGAWGSYIYIIYLFVKHPSAVFGYVKARFVLKTC